MALTQLSISMPLIQIPVYIRELGATIPQIGLFFTVSMVFPLLVRVFGGWLADSVGRLRVIFVGSLTGVLTYAAYAVAPNWQSAMIAPALMAITSALTLPAYFAYIADIAPPNTQGRMYGVSQTVYRAAGVIAPPIGGLLGAGLGYRVMFASSTVIFGIASIIFFFLLRDRPSLARPNQEFSLKAFRGSMGELSGLLLAGGVVTWILLVDGVRDIAFSLSFDLMPVYLTDIAHISKEGIGLLFGIYGIAPLLTLYPAGLLVDRTSERAVIAAALCCVVGSRLVFALASGFWGFALSWILLGTGASLFEPSGGSLVARVVPRRLRGTFFGLFATTISIFSLPAPWIGSQIWDLLGPRFPFFITVALGSLTILPAWYKLYVPRTKQPAGGPPAGTPEIASVLSIAFQPTSDDAWLPGVERIIDQHHGVLNQSDQSSLSACFGLAPQRAPPQVGALLATHAALSIADHLRAEAAGRPLQLDMGISSGSVGTGIVPADRAHDPGVGDVDPVDPLEGLLQEAQLLQQRGQGAGLLISEATYAYLGPAQGQFKFGGNGPLQLSGSSRTLQVYQVMGRLEQLNPTLND